MWTPTGDEGLAGELRAHAKDIRNWMDVIKGSVIDLEYVADKVEARFTELTSAQLQHLMLLRSGYEADPTRDLADTHRSLERWTQALKYASREQ
jgi:hypothetical protein